MKELVEATGIPKSTILYYAQEGMLPEPVKTSRNMAYYDPKCIDRIRYIQFMQQRHRLSLAEIRQVIEKRGDSDYAMQLALNNLVFGETPADMLLDKEAYCEATGLTTEQVDALLEARLLLPLEPGCFDPEDVLFGRMFVGAFSFGLKIEHVTFYVTLGEQIVDQEFALKRHITGDLPYDDDAAITLEMVRNARISRAYIIDRLFQRRVASMRDLKD